MIQIKNKNLSEKITGYLYMLPVLLFIVVFMVAPIVTSLVLSFFKWKGYGDLNFIGLANYIKMFSRDLFFFTAFKNTVLISISVTAGTIVVGFFLAILIDYRIHFWKIYRFIFFLPVVMSSVVIGLLWTTLLNPYGLINQLLDIMHLGTLKHDWLGDSNIALVVIIFTVIWAGSGVPMLWFLAGLQNIDAGIYEAAKIDGASTMKRIISISIPLLKNVFAIIIALQFIFSFRIFDVIWVMTGGGPAGATEVLGTHLYKLAFQATKFGYASVLAVIMFIISLILSLIYIKISGYQETIKKY